MCLDCFGNLNITVFRVISFLHLLVDSNGFLAVKPKNAKLSYAETVKVTTAVERQDYLIGNGRDPITSLIYVDIKKK